MKQIAAVLACITALVWQIPPLQGKVYDCFPFFNEMELLKMRLEELDGVIDHFVLVESIETQRGALKPLYFKENRHLFERYLPKIIHFELNERHPEMSLWVRWSLLSRPKFAKVKLINSRLKI